MNQGLKGFTFAVASMLWVACAQVSAPSGGPKDENPPVALRMDPPTESVGIRPDRLVLEFDEYVQLRNTQQQLVVSPPLQYRPEWRMRGKSVELTLDPESFEPNRTYVFAFGGAVVDLHESNPAEDLKWAFSTGPVLDTLKIEGRVTDRMTRAGKPKLRVMLYRADTPWDSVWAGQRPDALGQTTADGTFSIGYLSPGEFTGLAFEDANGNYRWDAGEFLALDSARFVAGDGGLEWAGVETEPRQPSSRLAIGRMDTTGMIRVQAPAAEGEEFWQVLRSGIPVPSHAERDADSVMVWVDPTPAEAMEAIEVVWNRWDKSDTSRVRMARMDSRGKQEPIRIPPLMSAPLEMRQWKFDRAVFIEDASRLRLTRDSVPVDGVHFAASEEGGWTRWLCASFAEEFGAPYELMVLPGALRLQGHGVIQDTMISTWSTRSAEYFGALNVNLTDVPGPGWLRLGEDRFRVERDTLLAFPQLEPGLASLGFEWDVNRDSIWQTVDPPLLQSAEPYFYPAKQPEIRSNWLVEWNWSLKQQGTEQ